MLRLLSMVPPFGRTSGMARNVSRSRPGSQTTLSCLAIEDPADACLRQEATAGDLSGPRPGTRAAALVRIAPGVAPNLVQPVRRRRGLHSPSGCARTMPSWKMNVSSGASDVAPVHRHDTKTALPASVHISSVLGSLVVPRTEVRH